MRPLLSSPEEGRETPRRLDFRGVRVYTGTAGWDEGMEVVESFVGLEYAGRFQERTGVVPGKRARATRTPAVRRSR